MSTYVDKPLSLIEKKKRQWAKEREELAGLSHSSPWNLNESQNFEAPFQTNRYVPKIALVNNEFFRKDYSTYSRRSSLPPLYKPQYNPNEKELAGGETSGYGSDNPQQIMENIQAVAWNQSGYESSSSYKDDRPKWKDKNGDVGKFWEAKENEPPNWVKRGLQRDHEIVVSNTSPAESPQQDYAESERPYTSSCASLNKSHIRGQNIQLDSTELAERERRRQIAMAHQEAIRQQLEERERMRKAEREKRIKEEQEEELRIEREQEIERQRRESELRAQQEKQEREKRRKEAIQEALEIAEKQAKLEKIKQRQLKNVNHNKDNNMIIEEKDIEIRNNNKNLLTNNNSNNAKSEKADIVENEAKNKNNVNLEQQQQQQQQQQQHCNNLIVSPRPELEVKGKSLNTPRISNEARSLTPINNDTMRSLSLQILATPRGEASSFPLILQAAGLDSFSALSPSLQYAVIMPAMGAANPAGIPIAIPVSLPTDRSSRDTPRTENRILTPTQYRNKNRTVCDMSTQTETSENSGSMSSLSSALETTNNQKYVKEKQVSVQLNYDNRNKKERRSGRVEERGAEDRPKWGANRPPTRYMKQSEKDLLYQRKKMRQKGMMSYDYKNSSDESQTGSPRVYRNHYPERKHARSLWRKKDRVYTRNIKMYQTELVPLESDKDQIYYKQKCDCCCRCGYRRGSLSDSNGKADILRIEHAGTPRKGQHQYYSREDHHSDALPDCSRNAVENPELLMEKLSSLHDGLLVNQENWERIPRTPSLSSSARNTERNRSVNNNNN